MNPMGTFDYIIAHGFYSWINDEMKDRVAILFPII